MENNKIGNKKKFLLPIYLCIAWFLSYSYTFINYYKDEMIKTAIIILSFIVTTVFYYICKNWIFRLLVMISAVVGLTVIIGYEFMLTVFSAFAVIYVYKFSIAENSKNGITNGILLTLAPITAIAGLIINFKAMINQTAETWIILAVFVISFLLLIKCSSEKKSKKKLEKTNKKDRELEKKIESIRKTVFSISIIGVLSSAASYKLTMNNGISFFPWFFFILLLIYENDKSLYSAGVMLVNKTKAFLE